MLSRSSQADGGGQRDASDGMPECGKGGRDGGISHAAALCEGHPHPEEQERKEAAAKGAYRASDIHPQTRPLAPHTSSSSSSSIDTASGALRAGQGADVSESGGERGDAKERAEAGDGCVPKAPADAADAAGDVSEEYVSGCSTAVRDGGPIFGPLLSAPQGGIVCHAPPFSVSGKPVELLAMPPPPPPPPPPPRGLVGGDKKMGGGKKIVKSWEVILLYQKYTKEKEKRSHSPLAAGEAGGGEGAGKSRQRDGSASAGAAGGGVSRLLV